MKYVIGCGGVGSYLVPVLAKLVHPDRIICVDGDKLEKKNLDRQLFDENDIGKNKAYALAGKYGTRFTEQWFDVGWAGLERKTILFVCVDNHIARRAALDTCDTVGCTAIIAANESYSAEAYIYFRKFKDTPADPRVYYPEILTDRSGDPRAAAIGCTGHAQVESPQLASANFMAAALAIHLYQMWFAGRTMKKETLPHIPHRLNANKFALETRRVSDAMQ